MLELLSFRDAGAEECLKEASHLRALLLPPLMQIHVREGVEATGLLLYEAVELVPQELGYLAKFL